MNNNRRWTMVARDLVALQGYWILWALGIFITLNLVGHYFSGHLTGGTSNFLTIGLNAATGYLLVIGIITATEGTKVFLKVGVTRKEYFLGNLLSTLLLATGLVAVILLVHLMLGIFLPGYESAGNFSVQLLIEGVLQSVQHYLLGWLIVLGFKRYSKAAGVVIIVLLIGLMGIYQSLWSLDGSLESMELFLWVVNLEIVQIPFGVAASLSALLIGFTLWVIHRLTSELEINV